MPKIRPLYGEARIAHGVGESWPLFLRATTPSYRSLSFAYRRLSVRTARFAPVYADNEFLKSFPELIGLHSA